MSLTVLLPTLLACTGASPDDTADTADTNTPPAPVCTGFAAEAQSWAIPQGFVYDYNMDTRDGLGHYWNLQDLDGDGFLDLVQTAHGNNADADEMGTDWYVWWGDGAGFGSQTRFALPLDHREISGFAAANDIQRVLDMDGDGDLDLVLAQDPETRDVWDAEGTPHWRVHLNGGREGFAVDPVAWGVPEGVDHQVHSARTSGQAWTTMDLDGDGLVELVHTIDPSTGGNYGYADDAPHWRVYPNNGAGFDSTADAWPIAPSPTGYDGWYVSHTDGAYLRVRTQDVTGDGLADLISPTDSAWPNDIWGGTADPHWRVHVNNGAGFDAAYEAWSVPLPEVRFPGSAGDWTTETSKTWDTLSMDGGAPALVLTQDPATGAAFTDGSGDPVWHVHWSTGAGFADTPHEWALPDPLFATFWETGGAATAGWTIADLDNDGCVDLVLTAGLELGVPQEPSAAWSWWVWYGE